MRGTRMILVAAILLVPSGCNTPDSVADFCGASEKALLTTEPIFADLGGSCLREVNLRQEIGSFTVVDSDPGCAAIQKQADASVATVQLLDDYFAALHALAKFGVAKTGSDANDLAAKAAGAFGAGADAQTAVGTIAKFLTTAATGAYQLKSLNRDIAQVNTNVAAVTDALVQILQENYLKQGLDDEQKKLTVHYREYAQAHPDGTVTLLLDDRWRADRKVLDERRAAAVDAVAALRSIKAGTASLAAHAGSLKAKEIPALLDPYTSQLQDLIPQIQKAF